MSQPTTAHDPRTQPGLSSDPDTSAPATKSKAPADPSTLSTPPKCTADFCLIPIGTPTASVSAQIADVQRLLRRSGVKYEMHSAGTTLGEFDLSFSLSLSSGMPMVHVLYCCSHVLPEPGTGPGTGPGEGSARASAYRSTRLCLTQPWSELYRLRRHRLTHGSFDHLPYAICYWLW